MSLMIRTASPIELAWNPMWFIPLIRSSTVMGRPANLLNSSSSTFWASLGISFEGTKTASVTVEGGAPWASDEVVMLNTDDWEKGSVNCRISHSSLRKEAELLWRA
jgi:hypothetical protein